MTKLDTEEKTSLDYLVGTIALGAVLLTAHLVHKLKSDYVSESGAIILLGLVIGAICKLSDHLGNNGDAYMTDMVRFNHATFLNIILPLIIFEAGYSIKHTGVMRNIGAVLLFAVVGTIVSTIIIGTIVYYWSRSAEPDLYELADEDGGHDGSGLFLALSFGALLSATDPVSVIALLGSRFDMTREPPLLYNLVFGESVLNDAVSIVLFEAFKQYINKPATAESMALAALVFIKIFVLSSMIGYVFGILTAVFFKFVDFSAIPHLEVSVVLLFAAASYYLNDVLELSGIMGVFVAARVIGHHAAYNMSRTSRETAPFVFKTLAALAESAVFFLMGAALWAYWAPWNFYLCAVTIVACLVSRAFVVFPLAALSNAFRKTEIITMRMQGFMWYSGLRGAIAFGLVVVLAGEAEPGSVVAKVCAHLLNSVLFTVLFTVLLMGAFAAKLLTLLGLDQQVPEGSGSPLIPAHASLRSRRSVHYRASAAGPRRSAAALDYCSVDHTHSRQHDRHEHDATVAANGDDDDGLAEDLTCYDRVRLFERRYVERYVRRAKVYSSQRHHHHHHHSRHGSARHSHFHRSFSRPALVPPATTSATGADLVVPIEDEVPSGEGRSSSVVVPPGADDSASHSPGAATAPAPAGVPDANANALGPGTGHPDRSHSMALSAGGGRPHGRRSTALYSRQGYDQSTDDSDSEALGEDGPSRRPYEYSRLF